MSTCIVAVALIAPAASAQGRIASEVRLGGGYDGNPALAATPADRRDPSQAARAVAMEDGVARLDAHAEGALGDSPAARVRLDVDGRVYGRGDVLFFERLALEASVRAGDVLPRCALEGTRLDVTLSLDSAWGGALACGADLRLPHGLWLAADAVGAVRAFDAGQVDGIGGGELSAGWRLDPVEVEIALSVMRRESDAATARRTEVSPWLGLRVSTEHFGGRLAYRFVHRFFESGSRTGGEHTGRLELHGMPLPWLGGYVDLEIGHAQGGPQALAYDRVQITAGLRLFLEWRAEPGPLPAEGPATVEEGGWVRFDVVLPGAARVSVVGDFNGWSERRGALAREGDRFSGRFRVGPGRHEYSLVVDGRPMRPPGAPRTTRDGFGGENAVLVVP